MLDLHALKAQDMRSLDPAAMARLAEQMLAHMAEQTRQIDARDQQIAQQAQALKFKDARIERITFELARLKAWRFGARTEAMNAEQRQSFTLNSRGLLEKLLRGEKLRDANDIPWHSIEKGEVDVSKALYGEMVGLFLPPTQYGDAGEMMMRLLKQVSSTT